MEPSSEHTSLTEALINEIPLVEYSCGDVDLVNLLQIPIDNRLPEIVQALLSVISTL